MSHVRQLTLLSQLYCSSAFWDEDLLISNTLRSWSWFSSFEIPLSQENFQDATPRLEISYDQSYHCENKFHQYDWTIHLLFGSVVQVLTNSEVLVSRLCRVAFVFWGISGVNSWEEDATFFELLKRVEVRPPRAGSRSKTYPEVPTKFRVSCGNPESRQGMVLRLGIVEGGLGMWVAPELLAVSGTYNSLLSEKKSLLCSVNPEFESTIDSQS